jgi:DNA-3-methyladenine glycosylase II
MRLVSPKAEYVKDFARCVANGELALEALKYQTDVEVSDRLMRCRGFGAWSAQYFLLRGLGRLDSLPADDIGLRRTVGSYLARRRRLTPRQLGARTRALRAAMNRSQE